MSSNPSAVSSKDVLYLALDDAAVTFGGQFREVALGVLITHLNPAVSSYAWYFLVGSIPGILLVRWYGWASRVWPPRRVLILSYLGRILLVLALWRVQSFWEALGCLFGIAAGSGLYSTSQAHYIAHENDLPATRRVVIRLRQAASALMMVGPVAAGLVLTALGFRAGFLLSALFYGVAAFWVSRVSPRPAGGRGALPANRPVANRWHIDQAAMAFLGVSFLTRQANVLAIAYTFHLLHRQSFGYGITLAAWGGAGFMSSVVLPRIRSHRQWLWVGLMFLVLGLCWAVLAHGVSFWPFVAISGFEGMATWVIQDLIEAHVLADAPAGRPGWPVPGWVSSTRWDRW